MASPNLVFESPRLVGSPTNLVFGAIGAPVVTVTVDAVVTLDATVTVIAVVSSPVLADGLVLLSCSVDVVAAALYDNRVTPWLDQRAAAPHQTAVPDRTETGSGWGVSTERRDAREMSWQSAQRAGGDVGSAAQTSVSMLNPADALWQTGLQVGQAAAVVHQTSVQHDISRGSRYETALQTGAESESPMQSGVFHALHLAAEWQWAESKVRDLTSPTGSSSHLSGIQFEDFPWQMAGPARNGKSPWPPAQPPGPTVYPRDGHLLFECSLIVGSPAHLVFGPQACYLAPKPGSLLYILPARFYMTTHNIFAQRLPDLTDIPIFEATISADAGSYCWALQASGPANLFDLLAPVAGLPVQLRVTMDGIPWVFAVDALQRNQKFGQTGVSISGRSVTALIGAPYLRAVARGNAGSSMLAQQLAADALQFSGVDLDWGLVDWLVPAGAWSHNGTPLDAVQAIAQAAGGYLQSHRSAATLLTRHPYSQRIGDNPGAPWGWMTGPADVELAPDAIITDGTERKDGADINAVYVSGTTQGVLGLVKRTGTAGDKLASMVTDALITDVVAARQRGLSVLGAAGAKYNVRLELPVLTGVGQPGVLDVGQLVQVNANVPWRGRVRAVSVAAKSPSLRQSVTLERHLEVA